MDRTVFSWHYYCWALGTQAEGREDYDPALEKLCDEGWGQSIHFMISNIHVKMIIFCKTGPLTFDTVKTRSYELGNSATFLTEFGTCRPEIDYPDSAGTKECEYVMRQMDQR